MLKPSTGDNFRRICGFGTGALDSHMHLESLTFPIKGSQRLKLYRCENERFYIEIGKAKLKMKDSEKPFSTTLSVVRSKNTMHTLRPWEPLTHKWSVERTRHLYY